MKLIDIDAFRKDLGLAERCEDCERDARECQYDQIYTRMDFCGWLDDAEIIDAVPVAQCERIVKLINDLIDNAVHHGADCGGAYFTNEEGLIESARNLLDALDLNERYAVKKLPGWHDSWSDIAVSEK